MKTVAFLDDWMWVDLVQDRMREVNFRQFNHADAALEFLMKTPVSCIIIEPKIAPGLNFSDETIDDIMAQDHPDYWRIGAYTIDLLRKQSVNTKTPIIAFSIYAEGDYSFDKVHAAVMQAGANQWMYKCASDAYPFGITNAIRQHLS